MNTRKKDITLLLAVLTIVISCLVIIGWVLNIPFLKTVIPGLVPMKFNTAACFGLLGIAVIIIDKKNVSWLRIACCLIVVTIASVTLIEYIFNWNAGIDQLLFKTVETPGRPSIPASINFLLISLVILAGGKTKFPFLSWLFLWIVFLSALFSFLGYLFSLPYFNDLPGLSQMALHTTVLFMSVSFAVYYARGNSFLAISFRKKMVAGFMLIMAVMTTLLAIYNRNDEYFDSSSKWLQHTNEVLQRSEEIVNDITTMESAVRGYLLTGQSQFIDSLATWKKNSFSDIGLLLRLTSDNPAQTARAGTLYGYVNDRLLQVDLLVKARQQKQYAPQQILPVVTEGAVTMAYIRETIKLIQEEEKKLLSKRTADNRYSMEGVRRIIFFFGFVMFVILVVLLVMIVRNINARIRAESEAMLLNSTLEKRVKERTEELLKAESKFHYTLDNMMEGAQIINFDWKYIYVNDALLKYSQFSRDELIGHTVMERYPGIDRTPIFKIFERCMYDRESVHLENEFEFPDGSTGWFELSYQPIPDGIFILSVDITKRKQSEEAIQKLNEDIANRERRFRSIIESSNDLVSLLDKNIKPVYRSPSAERMTGWSFDEMQNRGGMADQIHADDVHSFAAAWQESIQSPGKRVNVLFRSKHKTGHYIWLEGSFTNMLHDESLGAIVINLQDVSLRKRSEEQLQLSERTYRLIASSIPGSVISLFDRDKRYFLVEGDMLEKLGYHKEQLVGKTIREALPPERYQIVLPFFDRVFGGESFTIQEERPGYDTLARYVPLKDEGGYVYAVMVAVFDISELKNAQRSLAELNQQLEERITERTAQLASANKELESFSYSVSHDLRAPLRGIDGWSLALLEDYGQQLDERAHQYLARVRNETQRMGELIDDLLKLSRVSRSEIKLKNVDISALAKEVAERLVEENPQRVFEFIIEPGIIVTGDDNLLEIMLTNLFSNACKFTGKVSPSRIIFGSTEENNVKVLFIKDNGVGFDINNAKNLFGAFQRMHRQSEFPGSGIGLATVQRIINLHHGKVWAASTVGEGATFYFTIS